MIKIRDGFVKGIESILLKYHVDILELQLGV